MRDRHAKQVNQAQPHPRGLSGQRSSPIKRRRGWDRRPASSYLRFERSDTACEKPYPASSNPYPLNRAAGPECGHPRLLGKRDIPTFSSREKRDRIDQDRGHDGPRPGPPRLFRDLSENRQTGHGGNAKPGMFVLQARGRLRAELMLESPIYVVGCLSSPTAGFFTLIQSGHIVGPGDTLSR
jgi:hypothetical protein